MDGTSVKRPPLGPSFVAKVQEFVWELDKGLWPLEIGDCLTEVKI